MIFKQLITTMICVHNLGITHNDIKPANILKDGD